MDDIKQRVKDYIVDNFLMGSGGEQIEDETSFLEQDILDSTGVLELISFLEETCGITVEDEDIHEAINVGDTPWRNIVVELKEPSS